MDYSTNELASGFIAKLTEQELASIYWRGARLWLDTGDGELRLTFGPPMDRPAHPNMEDEPVCGHWVWTGLGPDTADSHPVDEDGGLVDDWAELADWMRESLAYCVGEIAYELKLAAERVEEPA